MPDGPEKTIWGREQREWLQTTLAPAFTLERLTDEPFLIRETARKFQWTTSLVTVWRRK